MPEETSTVAAIVAWIDHWQTLVGAVVGGVFALLVAFIVSHAQTRREQRAAASILLVDLLAVRAADAELLRLAKERAIADDDLGLWLAEKLWWRRPKLSALFDLEMLRVIDVHAKMATHLSVFKMQYSALEEPISRLAEDQRLMESPDVTSLPRSQAAVQADVGSVVQYFRSASDHAECAAHYLDRLVLSKVPTFSRVRMMLFRMGAERKSKELLSSSGI